jgi:hypothetical protein
MSALLDEAERLSGGLTLRYDRRNAGGEHDAVRSLSMRQRRSLIGAGYLSARRGEHPDVFADGLRSTGAGWVDMTDCDAILTWCRMVLAGIIERRAERKAARRRKLAAAAQCDTEYTYRTMQAIRAGFLTFWQYRKARGWT